MVFFQGASYAIGNAAFHNDHLYIKLKPVFTNLTCFILDTDKQWPSTAVVTCILRFY